MRLTLVVCMYLFGGHAALGQPQKASSKRPSEWTVEERLAVRLDHQKIVQRDPSGKQNQHNYAIDGSRNPELLLPHELFQSLLTGFVPDPVRRERQRSALRPRLIAEGLDETWFWTTLRAAAGSYIDGLYPPSPAEGSVRPAERSAMPCRDAFNALTRARAAFGKDVFDRMLYESVAPVTQVLVTTSAADPAAELRSKEGGCQQ